MKLSPTSRWRPILLGACLLAACAPARAQSVVWSAPSTDAQARGSLYVEADYLAHAGPYEAGGYQSYGVRSVYGISNGVEVGLNLFRTHAGGATTELQPNAKWQFLRDERRGVAAAAGGMLFVSSSPAGLVYSAVSKQFGSSFGPRVTGGAYGMFGGGSGPRAGAIAAVEQPIARRMGLVADWYSGANRVGYAGAGLTIGLSPSSGLYVGYSVGNRGRANNGFAVCYSRTF